MATTITYDHVTETALHTLEIEASSLGLRPGEWPVQLQTTVGNGLPFMRLKQEVANGELMAVVYDQANGCLKLRVFND